MEKSRAIGQDWLHHAAHATAYFNAARKGNGKKQGHRTGLAALHHAAHATAYFNAARKGNGKKAGP